MFVLFFILWLCTSSFAQDDEPEVEFRMLSDEEYRDFVNGTGEPVKPDQEEKPEDANFGDLIIGKREDGDILIWRETLINDQVDPEGLIMLWTVNFGYADINHVRALNFGRERGITRNIIVRTPSKVEVLITIRSNHQIRLMVEIYSNRPQRRPKEFIS